MHADIFDNLYVTLIGTESESEHTQLASFGLDAKISFNLSCNFHFILFRRSSPP